MLTLDLVPPCDGCTIAAHGIAEGPDGVGYADYCEPDGMALKGCAYLRTPTDPGGCFDIPAERDFDKVADAIAFAESYAERHGIQSDIY